MSEFDQSSTDRLEGFTTSTNKYEILGVPATATTDEIKLAYRRAALLYHPDRHTEANQQKATDTFRRVSAAYRTLSDAGRRSRYDRALSMGIEVDDDEVEETFSLREILLAVQTQEHIFSDQSLQKLNSNLANAVRSNLISDLSEQIVETIPIWSAPSGATHTGTFQTGALVVTTLRLLFPYWTRSETTSGNVKTISTNLYMPAVPLPAVQQLAVVSAHKQRGQIQIALLFEGQVVEAKIRKRNIGKILLMCRLWGIPFTTHELSNKTRYRRWAIWGVPTLIAPLVGVLFWLFGTGGLAAAVLTWCALAGFGYYKYRMRYGIPTPSEIIVSLSKLGNLTSNKLEISSAANLGV